MILKKINIVYIIILILVAFFSFSVGWQASWRAYQPYMCGNQQ